MMHEAGRAAMAGHVSLTNGRRPARALPLSLLLSSPLPASTPPLFGPLPLFFCFCCPVIYVARGPHISSTGGGRFKAVALLWRMDDEVDVVLGRASGRVSRTLTQRSILLLLL